MAAVPASKPDLLPLHCPNCQTPVPAREGEVAYLCQNCGQGLELTAEGLRQVDISFAAPQPQPYRWRRGTCYLPFWVFEGEVRIRKREAVKGIFALDKPSADHGEMWGRPRQFYVPAFEAPLRELQRWGVDLTGRQPDYPPGEKGELKGCVYTEEEARKLAEFTFLSIESRKPDVLQELDYRLELTSPRLLVVPFVGAERKEFPLRLGQTELSSLAQWWQTADRKKVVVSIILLIGLGYMACTCSRFAILALIFLKMIIESTLGLYF